VREKHNAPPAKKKCGTEKFVNFIREEPVGAYFRRGGLIAQADSGNEARPSEGSTGDKERKDTSSTLPELGAFRGGEGELGSGETSCATCPNVRE